MASIIQETARATTTKINSVKESGKGNGRDRVRDIRSEGMAKRDTNTVQSLINGRIIITVTTYLKLNKL